jgi:phosphatidylglycerophosphate synthase
MSPPGVEQRAGRRAALGAALRADRAVLATAFLAQLLLLELLTRTAGLGTPAWGAGIGCAVVLEGALALGLRRTVVVAAAARRAPATPGGLAAGEPGGAPAPQLGPASWVTLARATLAIGVAALVVDAWTHAIPVALLVALAAVALLLDLADGRVARRTGTANAVGARLDGEVDAFLILALSVPVAGALGRWVLLIGLARYAFMAGEWLLPWMRAPLPPARWRKLVAAAQGVVLTVAAARVVPDAPMRALLALALAGLAASMAACVAWLWRRRATAAPDAARPARAVLAVLAVLFVWALLVIPGNLERITPGAFARLPLELLAGLAAAALLPTRPRRVYAVLAGLVVGLIGLVKLLDMGFITAYDRRFDPVNDWSYVGTGVATLQEAIGTLEADLVVGALALGLIALLALPVAALLRATALAAARPGRTLPLLAALAGAWLVLHLAGATVASTAPTQLVEREVRAVRVGLQDRAVFARAIAADRYRTTPADRLLGGLRGKDVVVVVVESYGRVAVQGSPIGDRVAPVLARGTAQLRAAGFEARSGYLTSPTFGGLSWLAHATFQSGVWVDGQRRYDQLDHSRRFTLGAAFARAGWRTVADLPENKRDWPEGRSLYGFQRFYDRRNIDYRGPRFAVSTMPDQYALGVLQDRELTPAHRPRVFAEVDLTSSHAPWTRIPPLLPWDELGDGSVYGRVPLQRATPAEVAAGGATRANYARSIEYSLQSVVSFIRRSRDPNLVVVLFGDHQPATTVTGPDPSHEVPISIIAHDPEVLERTGGWGWQPGLRPGADAPVWPMSAFRDRFLGAFG